ncbi:MAG: type II toxin-antitoxin system VapB family antitoxin [Mycobacteriales bacterium]
MRVLYDVLVLSIAQRMMISWIPLGDYLGDAMPDLLIRDVPSGVVTAIEARAVRLGLSRSEYLRRRLSADVPAEERNITVTQEDLIRFSKTFADLKDPEVMAGAWD